jgi:hypothetical protein
MTATNAMNAMEGMDVKAGMVGLNHLDSERFIWYNPITKRADGLVIQPDTSPRWTTNDPAIIYKPRQTSNYQSLSDISAGDVQYYIDPTISQPFYSPVFATIYDKNAACFVDPMNNVRPQYQGSVGNVPRPTAPIVTGLLSSQRDSLYHREDLMKLQQRKHMESDWSFFWTNN